MEEKEKTKSILVDLPLSIYKLLVEEAKRNERAVTAQARMIFRQWFEQQDKR